MLNQTSQTRQIGAENCLFYFLSYQDTGVVLIISRASVKAATQLVNNAELVQLLQTQEATTRAACVEYDCDQGDYSYLGVPHDASYKAYTPFKAIRR